MPKMKRMKEKITETQASEETWKREVIDMKAAAEVLSAKHEEELSALEVIKAKQQHSLSLLQTAVSLHTNVLGMFGLVDKIEIDGVVSTVEVEGNEWGLIHTNIQPPISIDFFDSMNGNDESEIKLIDNCKSIMSHMEEFRQSGVWLTRTSLSKHNDQLQFPESLNSKLASFESKCSELETKLKATVAELDAQVENFNLYRTRAHT
jgi:hypothetical protein